MSSATYKTQRLRKKKPMCTMYVYNVYVKYVQCTNLSSDYFGIRTLVTDLYLASICFDETRVIHFQKPDAHGGGKLNIVYPGLNVLKSIDFEKPVRYNSN